MTTLIYIRAGGKNAYGDLRNKKTFVFLFSTITHLSPLLLHLAVELPLAVFNEVVLHA